jgi:Family of unknown function (DUF6152)
MRGRVVAYVIAAVAFVASANSAFAHHPFSAEFDANKPVMLMGTITRVNWENPHTYVFLDVKDSTGTVSNWKVELGSPVALTNRGWHRDMLKTGESVTVDGWQAKDGSHLANARSLTMPNGKTMSAASSYTGTSKKTPPAAN